MGKTREHEASVGAGELESGKRLSPRSIKVLQAADSLAPELVVGHPEIAVLYRETDLTQTEIAMQVVPDITEEFPSTANAAVREALSQLITREERAGITARRRQATLRRVMEGGKGEEGFKEHQSAAAKKWHEKHSLDTRAMLRARGITPWEEKEKQFAHDLRIQPDYQHQSGRNKGKPLLWKIAGTLNQAFHPDTPVRNARSIYRLFNNN